MLADAANDTRFLTLVFQPKGQITLETQVIQSVLGPVGPPASEAMYPPVAAADGKPMSALNNYKENWLAINRGDERIDLSLRIYAADLEKMKTWKAPSAVLVK